MTTKRWLIYWIGGLPALYLLFCLLAVLHYKVSVWIPIWPIFFVGIGFFVFPMMHHRSIAALARRQSLTNHGSPP